MIDKMANYNKRQLDETFLKKFEPDGDYSCITEIAKEDPYLDFEMRGNRVEIYYRGGVILTISDDNELKGLDPKYDYSNEAIMPQPDIKCISDYISKAKCIVDKYENNKKVHLGEKEIQQRVAYENNLSVNAKYTDYFIADTEWQNNTDLGGRADIVAFQWLRTSRRRKNEVQLTLIEVKQGKDSISGECGLVDHYADFNKFLKNEDLAKELGEDMLTVLIQKQKLGLIKGIDQYLKNGKTPKISEKVDFVFLLANYHHYSKELYQTIQQLPDDSKFFVSSFMGYGLYHQFVKTKDELMKLFPFVFKE